MSETAPTGGPTDADRHGGYAWSHDWVGDDGTSLAMAHTGIVLTRDGSLVTGAASEPVLITSDSRGRRRAAAPVSDATELHGLTLVVDDGPAGEGAELIWVADTATKVYGGAPELVFDRRTPHGRVFQIDLAGNELRALPLPAHPAYADGEYSPTSVAVDERRHGGSGDIWVADGYGASLLHRFDASGGYVATLTGKEGAGRFDEPHDVLVDRRGESPVLLVADRTNHRIQAYTLDGTFRGVIGERFLAGPTQLAVAGDLLVVTDILAGRVTLIDPAGELVAHLFPHPTPPTGWDAVPGEWPNSRDGDGLITALALEREVLVAPHGVAVAADGTIYVNEFAIGGRTAALSPTGPADRR